MNDFVGSFLKQEEEKVFVRFMLMRMINTGSNDTQKVGKILWWLHDSLMGLRQEHPLLECYIEFYNTETSRERMTLYWQTLTLACNSWFEAQVDHAAVALDQPIALEKIQADDLQKLFAASSSRAALDPQTELLSRISGQEGDRDSPSSTSYSYIYNIIERP